MAVTQETILDQAIRVASCGSTELTRRLQDMKPAIAAFHCAGVGMHACRNPRELYLRYLYEILKLALIQAAQLVDYTEAREDANRKMEQRALQNMDGRSGEEREGHTDVEMRFCSYRKWNRHRTGDDQSDSLAKAKSRANSYSFYRDTSRQKSASAQEGRQEYALRSNSEGKGEGSTDATRRSNTAAAIKPKHTGNDSPPTASVTGSVNCDYDSWTFDPAGVAKFFNCITDAVGVIVGYTAYDASNAKGSSGFATDAGTPPPFLVPGTTNCTAVGADPCDGGVGQALWTGEVGVLPETYSVGYSGTLNLGVSVSGEALTNGFGFDISWTLTAGEKFSQTARLERGYGKSKDETKYCGDDGTTSADKGRNEDIAGSKSQTKADKHRRSEKASEAGSSLEATSTGTMRFSGQSSTGADRTYVKKQGSSMQRQASKEIHTEAQLQDVNSMKMHSITEYRHQIAKMVNDLMKKTWGELEEFKMSSARRTAPKSSTIVLSDQCDTPMEQVMQRYYRPIRNQRYPLRPTGTMSDLIRTRG